MHPCHILFTSLTVAFTSNGIRIITWFTTYMGIKDKRLSASFTTYISDKYKNNYSLCRLPTGVTSPFLFFATTFLFLRFESDVCPPYVNYNCYCSGTTLLSPTPTLHRPRRRYRRTAIDHCRNHSATITIDRHACPCSYRTAQSRRPSEPYFTQFICQTDRPPHRGLPRYYKNLPSRQGVL